MTTETTFPVSTGTLITVKCHDGLTNIGSEIITCQNKIHYKFDDEPGCEPKGEILQQIFVKNFVFKENNSLDKCWINVNRPNEY